MTIPVPSLHSITLGDVLREHRRSRPLKVGVVCGETRLRYPELDDRTNRLARALLGLGFERGDRILWLGQNCHRLLEALLASAKLGGALCPINWRQSADEIAFVVRDLRPKVIFWQGEELGPILEKVRSLCRTDAVWIPHDAVPEIFGYETFVRSAPADDPAVPVDPTSGVLILYTAAFGGRPNGAEISHTALLVQGLVTSIVKTIGPDDIYLASGPLFHMATLVTALSTFLLGGTNVFTRRSDPEEICRLVERERCTGAFLVAPTIERIVELNRSGRFDLKSLRAYPASDAWNRMITIDESPAGRRPGGYGQTEVAGHLTFGALGIDGKGSSGRPMPLTEVRIVLPDGNEVPSGDVGEIVARGPTMMIGYHDRPEETRARQAGGWHHTGDLGRREIDGSITFIGTATRMIKSGAENVYPAEVEGCILQHPAIRDCAVIGVPDPTWGQSVKAIVVLKDGENANEGEIIDHVKGRIASYKKPRFVEFALEIPRKGHAIDYDELDHIYGGGGYPGDRRETRR